MFRILFLLLIVMSSVAFAQTNEKTDAYKYFEYEVISNQVLEGKFHDFCGEIIKKGWVGWIVNYGNPNELFAREESLKRTNCRQEFPEARLKFVRGGRKDIAKTEFWIVPPDLVYSAETVNNDSTQTEFVQSKSKPYRLEKFGEVSDVFFSKTFNEFFEIVKSKKEFNGYIVMRGTEKEIETFESRIKKLEFFEFYNSAKIIFLRKVEIQPQANISLWLIPQGSEYTEELDKK